MKLLGIDFGETNIGLALGSTEENIATPFGLIKNKGDQDAFKQIKKVVEEEEIERIVMGLPVSLREGDAGEMRARIEQFAADLHANLGVFVELEDERLTTAMSERLTRGQKGISRDAVAAMLILESYMEKCRRSKSESRNSKLE